MVPIDPLIARSLFDGALFVPIFSTNRGVLTHDYGSCRGPRFQRRAD